MLLDTTTRSIELVLAGAVTTNPLKITTAWVDMTATTTTPGATTASSNNTTAVTIVAAPAASTQRKVSEITIFNADTVSATVTVRLNDNSTLYGIVTIAVPAGYTLFFTDVEGWKVISDGGSLQMGVVGPAGANGIAQLNGINDQTGTSYTLALTDAGKDVRCTNASPVTLTVPPNSSVAFTIGSVVLFSQGGAGAVTATAGSGVTLRAANGASTTALYDIRGLEKTDTDTWRVV